MIMVAYTIACYVEDIYGAGYVTPQMGVAGAFLIVLGVYLMIFGFRGFRPTLAVSGFLTFGKNLLNSSFVSCLCSSLLYIQ